MEINPTPSNSLEPEHNSIASPPPAVPKRVFLCYCQKDARYAQRLLIHLAGCQHAHQLAIWDDAQIPAGSLWQHEIAAALEAAQFAVLLLSADFFASPFLTTQELPRLLTAAQVGGTILLPVILRPCLFEESPLAQFRPCNDPTRPLACLSSPAREQLWVSVVRSIIHHTSPPLPSR